MPKLYRTSRAFVIIATLLSLFIIGAPGAARAAPIEDMCADGQVDKAIQASFNQGSQQMIEASNAIIGLFGALDAKAGYCLDNIKGLFDMLPTLADPYGVANALYSAVASQLLSLMDQACAAAFGAVSQLQNFAYSQLNRLCIPYPDLNLGIDGLNLGLQNAPPCQGIPAAGLTPIPGSLAIPLYNPRALWPIGQ